MNDYVLVHHGVLGQKWGVRRFQNKDGSRTSAGKKRYASKENRDYGKQEDNVAYKYNKPGESGLKGAQRALAAKGLNRKNVKRVAGVVGAASVVAAGVYVHKHPQIKNSVKKTLSGNTGRSVISNNGVLNKAKRGESVTGAAVYGLSRSGKTTTGRYTTRNAELNMLNFMNDLADTLPKR